jgi:hypothetical protein
MPGEHFSAYRANLMPMVAIFPHWKSCILAVVYHGWKKRNDFLIFDAINFRPGQLPWQKFRTLSRMAFTETGLTNTIFSVDDL